MIDHFVCLRHNISFLVSCVQSFLHIQLCCVLASSKQIKLLLPASSICLELNFVCKFLWKSFTLFLALAVKRTTDFNYILVCRAIVVVLSLFGI